MSSFKPARTDTYPTATSEEQAHTENILSQHRPLNGQAQPALQKNEHAQYLLRNFIQGFPARFISQDASQPWLYFWTLQSFYALGIALDPQNKQRAVDTIIACQHPEGGFGGGPGQAAHLLPTYASVSALAIVGRPGPGGGWDQIDRKKLYAFFMSLKQPDGSFLVAQDSEVDVRGTYCLLCVAVLLNLLTPELISGTAAFIASLQTYEGGFASASQPYFTTFPHTQQSLLQTPRPPLGEAHGGYTFCALASWVILRPFLSRDENGPQINVKRLVRWLTHMQGSEMELGGFRGRTNKLVDACYAWWVAGGFALLRPLGVNVVPSAGDKAERRTDPVDADDDGWADIDDSLFNRHALQEYILYASQEKAGGLRDKPPKKPDSYHTSYALSGLASAQHHVVQVIETLDKLRAEWKSTGVDPALDSMRKKAFAEACAWTEDEGASTYVNGARDRVNATHPVFNLTITHAREIMNHSYGQG